MERVKERSPDNLYDVVVIGGGPAGLTAALYLARAKYRVAVVEKEQLGGQITITNEVVNYPGVKKVSGKELTETMKQQAEAFGAEFISAEATALDTQGDVKTVHTNRGDYDCLGILLATGAHPRTIGFKGEQEHKGRGVAYCATCDGEFFSGKEIFVIGGGYAAAEESVFLTKFARHITILIREDDFTCAAAVAEPAKHNPKITVLTNVIVQEVAGENGLDYIRYKNTKTGDVTEYRSDDGDSFGVFVFAGYSPDTALIKGLVELDEQGYIITDTEQRTNIPGVYAAGDVCIKSLRQVVTATGEGALAATELEKYVAAVRRKTDLHPKPPTAKTSDSPSASKAVRTDDFTDEMKEQLEGVFCKLERKLLLKLFIDDRPVCAELEGFITNLAGLSDKLAVTVAEKNSQDNVAPCVRVCLENGEDTGIAFHGVPSGHEFTSFVIGLYNAAGPGQMLDDKTSQEIDSITKAVDIKIMVSLSCTMCPDTVTACQRIATKNPNVRAEVYDIHHFEALKNKYNIMSVPCLVINNDNVYFGKKNIHQIIELIKTV